MSSKNKPLKASDVFNQTNFFFEKTGSFSQAFPTIEKIKIVVLEEGEGVVEQTRERHFTESNLPNEYINCQNPRCYNGGFSVGALIRQMIETNQTELETKKSCQGYEGSPKGRVKYDECDNTFNIKINITLKQ